MYIQIHVDSKTTAVARANVSVCTSTHVFFEYPLSLSLQVKQNNKDLSYLYITIQSATARTPTILIYSKTTAPEGKQVAGSPSHGGSAAGRRHWVSLAWASARSLGRGRRLGQGHLGGRLVAVGWGYRQRALDRLGHRGRVVAPPWPPSRRR